MNKKCVIRPVQILYSSLTYYDRSALFYYATKGLMTEFSLSPFDFPTMNSPTTTNSARPQPGII